MDKPTLGLDCKGRQELLKIMVRLKQQKITLVVSSHDVNWVNLWATHVAVIARKTIAIKGTIAEVFGQEELLQNCGIEIPLVVAIGKKLQEKGYVDAMPKTEHELNQIILSLPTKNLEIAKILDSLRYFD